MVSFSFLKKYDLYIKPHEDFQVKTTQGGLVTLTAIILTTSLFLMELSQFLSPEIVSDMRVDKTRSPSLTINLDMTFHKAPCDAITFSAIDVSGKSQPSVDHTLAKQRLDKNGEPVHDDGVHEPVIMPQDSESKIPEEPEINSENEKNPTDANTETTKACGSCYGAENMKIPCCNTCTDVKIAYQIKGWKLIELDRIAQCVNEEPDLLNSWAVKVRENIKQGGGCRIHGKMTVNRVAGTLYVAPGHQVVDDHGSMVHKFPGMGGIAISEFVSGIDFGHTVNRMQFGEHTLPDQEDPLMGVSNTDELKSVKYTYFLKIVPSTYESMFGNIQKAAQYSMTQHGSNSIGVTKLPGVWIDYQISPMVVRYKEVRRSLSHFLTNLCAIIGGIFAVAGLLDSTVHRSVKHWRKQQLGKD